MHTQRSRGSQTSTRLQLQEAWRGYLDLAVARWEKYLTEFAAQDKELADNAETAQDNLRHAQTNFNTLKEEAGEKPEAEEIADEDEMKIDPGTKLQQGTIQTQEGLQNLKNKAAEILEADPKRAKTDGAPMGGRSLAAQCDKRVPAPRPLA